MSRFPTGITIFLLVTIVTGDLKLNRSGIHHEIAITMWKDMEQTCKKCSISKFPSHKNSFTTLNAANLFQWSSTVFPTQPHVHWLISPILAHFTVTQKWKWLFMDGSATMKFLERISVFGYCILKWHCSAINGVHLMLWCYVLSMSTTYGTLHEYIFQITIIIAITLTLNPLRNSFFIDHATFLQGIQIRIPSKFPPRDIGDAKVHFPVILPFLSLNTLTRSPSQLHKQKS